MSSKAKNQRVHDVVFDNDESLWDIPFRPSDTRGLAQEIERLDSIARRVRLALPLEQRMNVLYRPFSGRRGSK